MVESQGTYIGNSTKAEAQKHGRDAAGVLMAQLMATEQLDDQLSGLKYLQAQPYVDRTRIADIGCSYGGIETLFGAASGAGYKAAVAISPGAESWEGNKHLQDALIKAIANINIPTFVLQPAKDASLEPSFGLGPEFQRLGKPYGLEIYPPFGSEQSQQHCFGSSGPRVWGPDVFTFLSNMLH